MKGIILAGGSGTRLHPLTSATSKQLLPIYDKPMIYYPLSVLMLAGIQDILVITTESDSSLFKRMLGDGSDFGIRLSYAVQHYPHGIVEAFLIGEDFIDGDACVLILGDNVFYGNCLRDILQNAYRNAEDRKRATIFGYYVKDPERFGVIEFDKQWNVVGIEEKPMNPKSNYAVTGLYFYPEGVSKKARTIQPSDRGELEITSLNELYLNEGKVDAQTFGRGIMWFDTGTFDDLFCCSSFVRTIENQQGTSVCVPEEIAYSNGWLSMEQINEKVTKHKNSPYYSYLGRMMKHTIRY